jgi:hypothetical protein
MHRRPILTAPVVDRLREAKQQIVDAVAGRVPERLVLVTVAAAVSLARENATAADVLSERVLRLVQVSLKALGQKKWKPDTALLLHRGAKESGHELSP